ncbi:MAG: VTT domain-containing protein [Rhizomicrobium sp.]
MTKTVLRIVALLAVGAGIVLAVVYRSHIDPAAIRNLVANSPLSPVVFIGLQILASLFFIPRTVLGIAAGLLFGLFWGSIWAIIGAVAGAAVHFAFVRWLGGGGQLDATPAIGRLIERAERGGWRAVAILRLTPLPHSVANAALALTNLSWRDYLIGSSIGMLPMTIVQVALGATGSEIFVGSGRWVIASLILASFLALTFFLKRSAQGPSDVV